MDSLYDNGNAQLSISLPENLNEYIKNQDWQGLDHQLSYLVLPGGLIFETLRPYTKFETIEYITSIRDANNEWEEDGIWHDDGSRVLAFSLSLNLDPLLIEGGEIAFRKKEINAPINMIPVMPFGTLIIFATGFWGWEHMVHRVKKGMRVVMAGWCS
jgi:hypothetical protein